MGDFFEDFIYTTMIVNKITDELDEIKDFGLFMTVICTVFHDRCIEEGLNVPNTARCMYNTILQVHESNKL